MFFNRLVNVVQYVTLAAVAFFVGMLVFYDPAEPTVDMASVDPAGNDLGAQLYEVKCSGCHGLEGEGTYAPELADGAVLRAFPDEADEIALVTAGSGGGAMPGFAGELTAEEIAAIVAFTREEMAGAPSAAAAESADPALIAAGAAIYEETCGGCHGADGEGGFGPQLAGGEVVANYPDVADQIAVVTAGRGSMPSYDGKMSPEDIEAVVAYTRTMP